MDQLKRLAARIAASNFVVFCILFVTGMIAYAPALQGDFIWDDGYLVGQNPFYKSPIFIFEVFKHYLYLDSFSVYYRPLQNISYMFDYWLWGHNPFGYHLSNVVYHTLTAFLLFLLLKALLPALSAVPADKGQPAASFAIPSFLVSLAWVAHPIHNAAVAYVAGRADSIACIFAISAWLLYLRANRSSLTAVKWGFPVVAAIFCLLGLCAKEIAFIWMTLFIFHLFVFSPGTSHRKKFLVVGAILLVIACYIFMRTRPGGGALPGGGEDVRTFSMRFMLMLRALGDYTWLIFYPNDLHMDRIVFTTSTSTTLAAWQSGIRFEYLPVIGTLMIVVFVVMSRSRLPGQRLRIFGAAWFALGFLPISNLFPLNAQVAEHWIYMPSMGFLLFLAGCALALPQKYHAIAASVAALAVIPLVIRTAVRSYDWADNERFYIQTTRAGGGSTRINLNLALVYEGRKEYLKAEMLLRDIVRRFPNYMPAKLNLGVVLRIRGKDKEAEELFTYDKAASDKISKEYPHTWTAAKNLAQMRFVDKKYDESLSILDDAINRYPGQWELIEYKAQVLQYLGRIPEAIAIIQDFVSTRWWHYDAYMALARMRFLNGDNDGAIAAFRHAALLDIRAGDPYAKIARIYLALKRPEEALEAQTKAVKRDPEPSQYLLLSAILDQLNRKQESDEAVKRAEGLRDTVSGAAKGI